ncbi:MAG: rRNA maturation RNase YbeY [Planctomycetaceae bacterium]|jgi:probable rRNA maturation factor|nr:rRNA maturation RNase YbeY [Planctomycetaceae bacterium]
MKSLTVNIIDDQKLLIRFGDGAKCKQKIIAILKSICKRILFDVGINCGRLNIVIVGGVVMRGYNVEFLGHDYVTDVISFVIDYDESCEGGVIRRYLEGDILACVDVAFERAAEFGWSPLEEFCLYAIHGALHLAGYDDKNKTAKKIMKKKENEYIKKIQPKLNEIKKR